MSVYDVAIIGGGPAGLTAASTLARQLHTAVVFDSHNYRNAKATQMHMVPGHEGKDPADFRRESKEGIQSRYSTIEFQDVEVTKVEKKSDSHFLITDGSGKEWNFRKLLLGVGSSNNFPQIEGFEELWATRIFHCLFCNGYEERGALSAGVLAVVPVGIPIEMLVGLAIHGAQNAAQLSERVTIYTNGNEAVAKELNHVIEKEEWTVESRPIRRLAEGGADSVTVDFEDGSSKNEKFLVNQPLTVAAGPFVDQLGLATTQLGDIQADHPFHQTSVPGVFAAGDCITPYKVIPGAISSGCNAAVGLSMQLQAEKHGFPSPV